MESLRKMDDADDTLVHRFVTEVCLASATLESDALGNTVARVGQPCICVRAHHTQQSGDDGGQRQAAALDQEVLRVVRGVQRQDRSIELELNTRIGDFGCLQNTLDRSRVST